MIHWKYVEGSGRGLILRHYPVIHLEGLRKTKNDLRKNNLPLGLDLNP
jgi:hypothetical protein